MQPFGGAKVAPTSNIAWRPLALPAPEALTKGPEISELPPMVAVNSEEGPAKVTPPPGD